MCPLNGQCVTGDIILRARANSDDDVKYYLEKLTGNCVFNITKCLWTILNVKPVQQTQSIFGN